MKRHLTTQILFPPDESKEKPADWAVDALAAGAAGANISTDDIDEEAAA
jgi:hypothetical protein